MTDRDTYYNMSKWDWFVEGFHHLPYILDCYNDGHKYGYGDFWEGLSWEIREETNFEDNNIEHLTECYDFNKELYDNLKQIKLMIEEKDPVKQILNDPNDELIEELEAL